MRSAFEVYIQDIPQILSKLDGKEYPEIYRYLSGLKEQFPSELTAGEMAEDLLLGDRSKDLPSFLIEYITELLTVAGEEGEAEAWNALGAQYYGGSRGFEQNFEKAVNYYKMAAEKGERQAQENLGYCYYYGR